MEKEALFKLSYGLYVLTTTDDKKSNGCIINTAVQAAENPTLLSVCVNKSNHTCDMLLKTKAFNVSVISQKADFELFKHFGFSSGRNTDKFADYNDFETSANNIPYITKGTNAYISAKVQKTEDLGSHIMFIAEITDMKVLDSAPSATYEYYFENIKPKPQKKEQNGETVWVCRICGYEYKGEELPADYICPLCKHPASDFEKVIK